MSLTTKLKAVSAAVLRSPKAKKLIVALIVALAATVGVAINPEAAEGTADIAIITAQVLSE